MTRLLGASALVGAFLWCYLPVRSAGWVFEDGITQHYRNRPLTQWTWTVVSTPASSHVVNVGVSLLGAVLLVWLASRLGLSGFGLWTVGIGWLLHPINVETVAYAASRGELMAALGVLVACLSASGKWWRLHHLIGIGLGLGWAMAAKESGVVGLLLVPLVVAYMHRHDPRWTIRVTPALVSLLLLSLGIALNGGVTAVANLGTTDFADARDVSWQFWMLHQATALNHWLGSFVWLRGFSPDIDVDLTPVLFQGCCLVTVYVIAVMGWCVRREAPIVAFGIAWLLVAVAPRFLVQTPQSYLNAHQMAVPIMGVLFVAGGVMMALERWADRPVSVVNS